MEIAGHPAPLEIELELARKKIVESYQMASLGRLTAGVIHEINTPIGAIVSNNEVFAKTLEILRAKLQESVNSGQPPAPRVIDLLQNLIALSAVDKMACERILSVVRGLKTFARVDEGELRRVNLADLVQGAWKLAQCEYKRRVTFESHFDSVPEVECYPHELGQVFLNLIVNAAQAMDGEGRIVVSARAEDGSAEVDVADTGRGIPPEAQSRIFQRGFTTKALGVGSGLGLSIAREIVEDHHKGAISFQSEPGKGTTFHLRIPLSQTSK